MNRITLSVPDVSCGHCKSSIEGSVGQLQGVGRINVSIEDKSVDVEFDEEIVDLDTITAVIEDQGYEVAS